jgi:S-DNA-T family DNA segregation ATPase FtsK/SpoIIIE
VDEARLLDMADRLGGVLSEFDIKGRITEVRPGPVVTLFELEPAAGVRSSKVIALAEDIARAMSATSARVAVIPGRNAIGIELPNPNRETVYLRDLLNAQEFVRSRMALPLALGESIEGQPMIGDLGKMPHLLIAGTTGSGKSVGINAMILSLMFKLPPEKCRFIMIDPKMLELSIYEGVPHLLSPVVTDPQKAVLALKWVVREMESRYG